LLVVTRARNGSLAHWIDFVSVVSSLSGSLRVKDALAGFRFVAPIDQDACPKYSETTDWKSLLFTFEGTTYTAVCFNHPSNPQPPAMESGRKTGIIGYGFCADYNEQIPLTVHYRFRIQEGEMSLEEMRAMSRDFLQPITIEAAHFGRER
jgi:hypothetical protein